MEQCVTKITTHIISIASKIASSCLFGNGHHLSAADAFDIETETKLLSKQIMTKQIMTKQIILFS